MNIRNILFLTGLTAFLAGCATHPRTVPLHDYRYDDDYYYDYRGTPSYEGFYYVRIIFIRGIPYYVDDDRYVRPIPPHLHDHFRRYPYKNLGRRPIFSRDRDEHDGYRSSSIIYFDGVPYHVEDDRVANPLPQRLQQFFPPVPARPAADGDRPQRPSGDDDDRGREPPAWGRDRDHAAPPSNEQRLNRIEQNFFGRPSQNGAAAAQQNGGESPETEREQARRTLPLRPGQHTADVSRSKERDHNSEQAKKSRDRKKLKGDKKKSRRGKKDEQGDSAQPDEKRGSDGDNAEAESDNDDKKDNRKQSRGDKRDDQENNDRENGNRRD